MAASVTKKAADQDDTSFEGCEASIGEAPALAFEAAGAAIVEGEAVTATPSSCPRAALGVC